MTRVLQIYRDYFTNVPGGVERHVQQLAHGLRHEIEVDVLVSSGSRKSRTADDEGVRVHMLGEVTRWQGLSLSPQMIRWLNRASYDILHVHSPYPMGELAVATSKNRAVRIATYHADLDRGARLMPAYRRFLWSVYERCSRVLVSSEELIHRSPVVSRLHERRPGVVQVVPFGIDTKRFSPGSTERSREIRAAWGPDPTVLFLGRLRYYKGLHILIRAVQGLDARLVVVGSGPMRQRIVPMAKELLGDRFRHIHRAEEEELPDLYRAADLFCLPSTSRAEAFGLSTVEAMACGLPVITTSLGTATSVVNRHEQTGLVVPPRDARALRSAISLLLDDSRLAEKYGENARRRAETEYSESVMFDRIRAAYSGAAASSSTPP